MRQFALAFLGFPGILGLMLMASGGLSLHLAQAEESTRGVTCLKKYATYIHQDISFDASALQNVTTTLQTHFKSIGDSNANITNLRWLVAGIPFGVAIVNSVFLIVDVYKIVHESVELIQNEIRQHKFGGTFELMTKLHQLAEEMNHSTEELSKESDLLRIEFQRFKNYSSYNKLSQMKNFEKIAASTSVPADHYPQLAQAMMEQYLFGDLFCGATEMFEPLSIDDLMGYAFLRPGEVTSIETNPVPTPPSKS